MHGAHPNASRGELQRCRSPKKCEDCSGNGRLGELERSPTLESACSDSREPAQCRRAASCAMLREVRPQRQIARQRRISDG